jgi:hypothetical protein
MSNSNQPSERIDHGISICAVVNRGKQLTCEEIAAYCDCSRNAINQIELKALGQGSGITAPSGYPEG